LRALNEPAEWALFARRSEANNSPTLLWSSLDENIYIDWYNFSNGDLSYEDILAFGGKFNQFYSTPKKLIIETLSQSYRDMLRESRGTAFSLPRDAKVWENVKTKFEEYLRITKLMSA
jgi:hypothetical protein